MAIDQRTQALLDAIGHRSDSGLSTTAAAVLTHLEACVDRNGLAVANAGVIGASADCDLLGLARALIELRGAGIVGPVSICGDWASCQLVGRDSS